MILKTVFVRFYKSFNFDYLRKYDPKSSQKEWEKDLSAWYPYIRIPIDPMVTTIVGANESGKSHLLSAIEKGISGNGIAREDFCRYSKLFTVIEGQLRLPDFGFEWAEPTENETSSLRNLCSIEDDTDFKRFFVFRSNGKHIKIYIPSGETYKSYEVKEKVNDVSSIFPSTFRIDAEVALPDTVPIRWLVNSKEAVTTDTSSRLSRKKRNELVQAVGALSTQSALFTTPQAVNTNAAIIIEAMASISKLIASSNSEEALQDKQLLLAHDLIYKIARIDSEMLAELLRSIAEGKDGYANGIIQKMNDQLATNLDFPHWWAQDRQFRLIISARDEDIVFTIRDRTETEYSFNERSSGLKYFLSYYIQYLAHESSSTKREILLMDEPDQYLSSQAQQDLLKIFASFACPEGSHKEAVQVIYVTHSPFLIDKNHAERVRVLEKGVGEEGTRVVRDAAKNHYEPLRSAFGSFVGETAFIGNCNLIVEGVADQILIAGASTYLQQDNDVSELEKLDLNRVTIVPAGSASHIPYIVYLTRGRDIEQPAVIVLLDSDKAGNDIRAGLKKGGPKHKQLLKPELVFQIGDLASERDAMTLISEQKLTEIEDLVPISLAVLAAQRYLSEFCDVPDDKVINFSIQLVQDNLTKEQSLYDAITKAVSTFSTDVNLSNILHIDKVGFARIVIDLLFTQPKNGTADSDEMNDSIAGFLQNMKILFKHLRSLQQTAERDLNEDRVSRKVKRLQGFFVADHPDVARRDQAAILMSDIEAALDDSNEADATRHAIDKIRKDFHLLSDLTKPIPEYQRFKDRIASLPYSGRIATQANDMVLSKPIQETGDIMPRSDQNNIDTPTADAETQVPIRPEPRSEELASDAQAPNMTNEVSSTAATTVVSPGKD